MVVIIAVGGGNVDQVEQIKQKIDIVEIIGERVTLKKAGRHFKGLCPFHSEKSPSFIVSPERQSYKCFGCQEGGDVFSFLQRYEGMSFLEALETMAKRVGITLESYRPTSQDSKKKKMLSALDLSSEYYHYLLTKHESGKEAREYLQRRGITNESILKFKLGWAPNNWRNVSDYLVKKKGFLEEELAEIGMLVRSEGGRYYERFRGRVMFPLRDHRGVVVGFSGRTLSTEKSEAKYINSPETFLYSKGKMLYGLYENREAVRKEDKIVLVEGELDVIPSVQSGVKPVVAIKGSAFTEDQARLIARYTKNIYMALDADSAGQEAIKRAVAIAENLDMSIRVVKIEGGKDPGEVATNSAKSWKEEVKKAVLYWDFLIESVIEKHKGDGGEMARAVSIQVVPVVANISNMVVRAHYVTELAKKLGVPEDSVYDEIERVRKKKELAGLKQVVGKIEKGETRKRREVVEEYLLSIALQNYDSLKEEIGLIEEEIFESRACKLIASRLKNWGEKKFEIKTMATRLGPELLHMLDELYLRDLATIDDVKREWEKVKRELVEIDMKDKLSELTMKIAKAEERKASEEEIKDLQMKFAEVSRKLTLSGK